MKINWKDLGLAMVVSLVLVCIIGIFFSSSISFESASPLSGGGAGLSDVFPGVLLIQMAGGFLTGTLIFYLLIEAWRNKKK